MADDPSSTPKPTADGPSELRGLDPGELLARGLQTVRPSVGAGPWEPPTLEEVSRLLPQYRIEQLIGRGGMGAVYKGIQLNLDRPVAIKLLPAEMAMDEAFVARFEREARTLAKLQHSRIVTIFDFGRTAEGHLYFVMEYIDGTDLRRILRGPGLDPEQALALVGQLCDALQAAHREGIVHRDLKPENVLITRDGYVKLADFGLARPPQEEGAPNLTQTNLVLGTPDYMAPEQRFGAARADARSDIFALGVMLYEMLTGQTPRGVFDPPSHKVKMDVRIDEVVLKALQSEPERRYQKASELKTAVENIRTTPLPAPAPASPATVARSRSRMPIYAAATGVLLLATLGAASYLYRSKTKPTPQSAHATPAPGLDEATAQRLEKIVPQYVWLFHNNELRFLSDGTATHPGFKGGFRWSVDRTVHNAPTIRLAEQGEEPKRALKSVLWFYPDFSGFTNYEYIDNWEGSGTGGVRLGVRLPLPNQVAAATPDTNPLAAQIRDSLAKAKGVYEALVGRPWAWTDLGSTNPASIVRFEPDGHCSGGWTWELIDRLDGTFLVDCSWGENGHQYLVFDPSLESFDSYDSTWTCVVKGQRVKSGDSTSTVATAPVNPTPIVAPGPSVASQTEPVNAPVATPAPEPASAPKAAPSLEDRPLYKALIGYKWTWWRGDGKGGTWRTTLTFHPDGTVSNPADHHTWYWWITNEQTVHLQFHPEPGSPPVPNFNEGMTVTFNAPLTHFRGLYIPDPKKPDGIGERAEPVSVAHTLSPPATPAQTAPQPATPAPTSVVAKATPVPASPAARRAAQIYDAIVGYHWTWANEGDTKPPLVVEFAWDGHVSGGWTWKPVYKPDGETLIDCAWGDNGHEYLRMNEACDGFVAFNRDGQFNVKGQRLGPIGQAANLDALAASVSAEAVAKSPAKQIEPLLEPCLNAILAPLGDNPQMPRVPVEKLQAVLSGEAVKAKTPARKQIYQYAQAVCESLTNGMDERALTKATAASSSWVPSLSNGGSIINTMPLHGRDAGRAGEAIRKKQKDERAYADKRADQYSIFMESSAYKAWVAKAALLRQNVMGLYTKLVQLEAAESAPAK
ncbi:serine/threonine-protein kinase [Chthoniobacter flavus]|nr:serine/threonine-protein kinase [Chthoniobacter flavus]